MKAIKDSGGIVTVIQKKLGCDSWRCAWYNINRFESTKEAYKDEKEKVCDIAESTLIKSVQEGNTQDAKWYLSKKGKDRGFGDESVNVTVNNTQSKIDSIADNIDKLSEESRIAYFKICEELNATDCKQE